MKSLISFSYKAFNRLYSYHYPLYQKVYFIYKGITDSDKLNAIKTIVKSGDIVVDIGANIGFTTLYLSKLIGPSGKVFSFEPDKLNFHHLKENTTHLKNTRISNCSVGSTSSYTYLYQSQNLNIDHQTYDNGEGRKRTKIKSISLDDYFKNKPIPAFIKIDVQGYEYQVALGMKKLMKNKNLSILSELWPYGLNKGGSSWTQYLDLFKKNNFKIRFFTPTPISSIKKNHSDPNFYLDFIASKN